MDLNNPKRTADEWINREIIPTDFEQLEEEDAHELFQALLPKKEVVYAILYFRICNYYYCWKYI